MKQLTSIALTAVLVAFAAPATAASDNLQTRAVSGLSQFIASQGNAALAGIRKDLTKDLRTRLKLHLPTRKDITPQQPAATPPPKP